VVRQKVKGRNASTTRNKLTHLSTIVLEEAAKKQNEIERKRQTDKSTTKAQVPIQVGQ
jgi:DNA-binding protein H-NS